MDCRISAYLSKDKICGKRIDLVMIDLELSNFKSKEQLDTTLNRTRNEIKFTFGRDFEPYILWSGNGYHIYIPIESKYNLEEASIFGRFDESSKRFLRFAEWYLSNGKADAKYFTTLSLLNCMLRIPVSYNSKLDARDCKTDPVTASEIRIVEHWNGRQSTLSLTLFLLTFLTRNIKHKNLRFIRRINCKSIIARIRIEYYGLSQQFCKNALHDHKKYVVWRILSPYLFNIRKLSTEEAYSIIEDWLDRCNTLKRLNFKAKTKIRKSKGYKQVFSSLSKV